ncbi:hypothetical protein BpHYR1_020965 [Brachionus plicatilis]|uniref:Uncharacterized protein n=1 Tax=Brachionus plicatilis TaxID=10195 RepID=A0A3M7SGD7_BRAPC|nr:hypothetical protein BpHYR1_020965 [Brachionus plicatilis]
MVRKTTDHKVNKFKFYADRSMKPASYVLVDRVWYLKPAHKKGVSKELSREHNYLIRPDVKGKKRLVHVNNLKRCYSPAENVRYETIIDTTDANTMGKENLSTTKESIHQANVSAPAPNITIVQRKESTVDQTAEEEANIEDSYWLDDQHLNLHMDDSGDNLSESDFEPNCYFKTQIKTNLLEKNGTPRPIRCRKPPERYGKKNLNGKC